MKLFRPAERDSQFLIFDFKLLSKSAYPCRCLCLGLEQITTTRPFRRTVLHSLQKGLTEARTFILLLITN